MVVNHGSSVDLSGHRRAGRAVRRGPDRGARRRPSRSRRRASPACRRSWPRSSASSTTVMPSTTRARGRQHRGADRRAARRRRLLPRVAEVGQGAAKPRTTIGDYWREPLDRPAGGGGDEPRLRHRRRPPPSPRPSSTSPSGGTSRSPRSTSSASGRTRSSTTSRRRATRRTRSAPSRASCSATLFQGPPATTSEELTAWAEGQPRRRRALPATIGTRRCAARWPTAATSSGVASRSGSGGS